MTTKEKYLRVMLLVTPTILRRGIYVCLCRAIAAGIVGLHERFIEFQSETMYRLRHTGQIYALTEVINDTADPVLRRCAIGLPVETSDTLLLYREVNGSVSNPVLTGRNNIEMIPPDDVLYQKIYKQGYGTLSGYNFAVYIPFNAGIDMERLKSVINQYKLISMRYNIITI